MCGSHFRRKTVLDGVSLKVDPLERLVIMGQSGSGKSTILRLILGILQPTAGEIFFKQFEITRLQRRKLQQVRTPDRHGLPIFRAPQLPERARQHRAAAGGTDRQDDAEIDEIVDEKLEMVGMIDSRDQMPRNSAAACANASASPARSCMEPELILFDEPTAGLDPVISSVIDELIISLTEKLKVTSIIVTHEMDSAFRIATRMAMLYQGKIIEDAAPSSSTIGTTRWCNNS